MGLAIGLLLIVLLMALAVLAFLITGIVFVVVGAKQKKKGGKGNLGKVGIGLEQFIVCTEDKIDELYEIIEDDDADIYLDVL